jgi:hypothetical protein
MLKGRTVTRKNTKRPHLNVNQDYESIIIENDFAEECSPTNQQKLLSLCFYTN